MRTCNLQFAYKEGHGTVLCTTVLKEIIHHYINNGNQVYACLLDASKAFDRISFVKLFEILLKRNIPSIFLRLILKMYLQQAVKATWHGYHSVAFNVTNGTRQGSLLSPHFFNLYMDVLISELRKEGIGCYLGHYYAGSFCYADDMTLACPSMSGLQQMINICEKYAKEHSAIFNEIKTKCIIFSKHNTNVTLRLNLTVKNCHGKTKLFTSGI